jgi:hypothetical protein
MNRKGFFPRLVIILSTALAIAGGLVVLAGTFMGVGAGGQVSLLGEIRLTLLNWAVLLAGFAVFVGLFNLAGVHARKVQTRQKGFVYSLILIFSMVAMFLYGVLRPAGMDAVFNTVQLPVEASLMAVLVVTLTVAAMRLLRRKLNPLSILFLATALLIMLATAPLPLVGNIPILSDWVRPFIAQVLAASGARGILLGVALGTLATGLRILLGAERPYGGDQ